jgi:hypothetical protein
MSFTCTDSYGALRVSRQSYESAASPVATFDKREMLPVSEVKYDEEQNSYYCFAVWKDSVEDSPIMWAYC